MGFAHKGNGLEKVYLLCAEYDVAFLGLRILGRPEKRQRENEFQMTIELLWQETPG